MAADTKEPETIAQQIATAVQRLADCRLEQLIISESGPTAIQAPEQYMDLPGMLHAKLRHMDHRHLQHPVHGPALLVSEPLHGRFWSAAEEPAARVMIVVIQDLGMAEAVVAADILLP